MDDEVRSRKAALETVQRTVRDEVGPLLLALDGEANRSHARRGAIGQERASSNQGNSASQAVLDRRRQVGHVEHGLCVALAVRLNRHNQRLADGGRHGIGHPGTRQPIAGYQLAARLHPATVVLFEGAGGGSSADNRVIEIPKHEQGNDRVGLLCNNHD